MIAICELPVELQERIYFFSLKNLRNRAAKLIQKAYYKNIAGSVLFMKEYVQARYLSNLDTISAPLSLNLIEEYVSNVGGRTKAIKTYAVQRYFDAEGGEIELELLMQMERSCRRVCGHNDFVIIYTGIMERFFQIQEALDAAELDDDAFFWS